jgi:hypothetical protein
MEEKKETSRSRIHSWPVTGARRALRFDGGAGWFLYPRTDARTVEVGGDGAASGEVEDEVEVLVDAAAEEAAHVGVARVPHRAKLR